MLLTFTLPATGAQNFVLNKHLPLILYFYPKDNTPGCTNEALDFKHHYQELKNLGFEVAGISRDTIKAHENFKAKYELPFALLSDTNETVCNLFNVIKMKNMYGKQVQGIERSTFILNKEGVIIQEWRKVKVTEHVNEVVTFIKTL